MEMLLKNLQAIKYLKIKTSKDGKVIKRQNGNVFCQFDINERFLLDIETTKEIADTFEKSAYYSLTLSVAKNFVTDKNYGNFEAKMAGIKFSLVAFEKAETIDSNDRILWQTVEEITTDSGFLKNSQGKEIGALTWRRVAIKASSLSFFCFYNLKKEALNQVSIMTFKINFTNMCYDLCFCPQTKTKDTTETSDGKKTITFSQKKTKKDNVDDIDKDEMIKLLKEQNALLMQLLSKQKKTNDVEDNDNDSPSSDSSDMTDKTNDMTVDNDENEDYLLFDDVAYRAKYGLDDKTNDSTNDLTDDGNDPHDDELPFN